jgi:hypothetical protein
MTDRVTAIQEEIITSWTNDGIVVSSSVTSRRRMYARGVANGIYSLEKAFELFKAEMNILESEREPYRELWYANLALRFQLGFPLIEGYDLFDNTGRTTAEIEVSKIVKHVAVLEQQFPNGRVVVQIKIAGDNGTDPIQLSQSDVDAVQAYFNKVKILGTRVEVSSLPADQVIMTWDIRYDVTILDNTGRRKDGTNNTPVQDAIKAYLYNLPVFGVYDVVNHVDVVQGVEGVILPQIVSITAKPSSGVHAPVYVDYKPASGWMRFATPGDLILNFIPYA